MESTIKTCFQKTNKDWPNKMNISGLKAAMVAMVFKQAAVPLK